MNQRKININALISACAKWDREAQTQLYDLYSGVIFNTCLRIVGNSEEAEEIMHDTFLKFFDKASSYAHVGDKIEYILRRIAINGSIDIVRKRKGFFIDVEQLSNVVEEELTSSTGYNIDQVHKIIDALPQREKALLSLRFKEGLSHKDIASEFQTSESAIKMLFSRVKKRIITLYNNEK